jgi:hypothetical protein
MNNRGAVRVKSRREATGQTTVGGPFAIAGTVLMLLGGLSPLVVDVSQAHGAQAVADLPFDALGTSAVMADGEVFVFGGFDNDDSYFDSIIRFNTTTKIVTTMAAKLPGPRAWTSAVWDGTSAYVFGGYGPTCTGCSKAPLRDIVRYDPSTDTAVKLAAELPVGRQGTSAVWNGSKVFIFAGQTPGGLSSSVLTFDPGSGTVATVGGAFSSSRTETSAIWDGRNAYVFGGRGCPTGSGYCSQIARYNTTTGAMAVMGAALPGELASTSAAWDGYAAHVFGGRRCDGPCYYEWKVFRYDTTTGSLTTAPAGSIYPRYGIGVATDGNGIYLFGGGVEQDQFPSPVGYAYSTIFNYTLTPAGTASVLAVAGPGRGETRVNWGPPASNTTLGPITGYAVYRQPPIGIFSLVASLPSTARSYNDSGLGDNETWQYYVTAFNYAGEGEASNLASVTTYGLPSAPRNVAASAGPARLQMSLTWLGPASSGGAGVTSYTIYRGPVGGPLSSVAVVPSNSFTDSGLTDNAVYEYRISAGNIVGEGPLSAGAIGTAYNATAPSAPTDLVARPSGVGTVLLTWTAAGDGGRPITGHVVYRGHFVPTCACFLYGPLNTGPATQFTDTNVPTGIYQYKVAARNVVGLGAQSGAAQTVAAR